MRYLAALLALFLAACAPAPVRPPQPSQAELEAKARLAQEQEALRLAELERAAAERELAERRRKEAEERKPYAGRITIQPDIAARPLEPKPEPQPTEKPTEEKAEPAVVQPRPVPQRVNPASFAWQLSDDLRQLHAQTDVQTLYNEKGWVVSLGAETLFAPGETQLKTDAEPALDKLARLLRHYAARGILMDGPDAERAQAVKRALTARGIPEEAIAANGTGERIEFLVPQ